MNKTTIIEKYLENYAEIEAKSVNGIGYHFQNVLIIPAYNEYQNLLDTLKSVHEKNCLLILVVNAEINSSPDVFETNKKLLRTLRKSYFEIWRSKNGQGISLHQLPNCSLLLIDRTSGQLKLPEKKGVGLARKIAADVALQLIHDKNVTSQWIHSTDADVTLPIDYFGQVSGMTKKSVAAIYPYVHVPVTDCPNHEKAVYLYELSLRHYVIGLKQAGSPYAFHTIGSTIAIKAESYAAVRGFPKREAGEDFYMLNKLAKIGSIEHLNGNPIKISGRVSDRVPFGTGQAVNKIQQLNNPIDDYTFYHPGIFSILNVWLTELKNLSPTSNLQKFEHRIRQKAKHPQLISGLEKMGAFNAIKNILQQKNTNSIQQLHTWFDGFRTLKLIHHIRDHGFPSLQLSALLEYPPYNEHNLSPADSISALTNRFAELERKS